MWAFRTRMMQIHSPDVLSSNGGNSFFTAYSPHQSPGPSLYMKCLDYLLTLGSISNTSISQIHCLLPSRCAASPNRVPAFIIAIQIRFRLQGCCLWATGERHIFCPYLALCWRHGYGIGTNRRGIGRASRWYYDGASSCYAWPLNEEFGILVKESAGRIRL